MRPPCTDHDPGDEDPHCEFERWMEHFERWMEHDMIGALCFLVKRAGLTMTLHGKPIEAAELREAALDSAIDRLVSRT